jgi:hypothetical protein
MRRIIQWSGVTSVMIFLILLSPFHDEAINAGSFFAGIALLGILGGMLRSGKNFLFIHGIISILLSILNFIIYYSRMEIYYLPVVQKITFAVFLIWLMNSCIKLRKFHAETK